MSVWGRLPTVRRQLADVAGWDSRRSTTSFRVVDGSARIRSLLPLRLACCVKRNGLTAEAELDTLSQSPCDAGATNRATADLAQFTLTLERSFRCPAHPKATEVRPRIP
jgi:hypothetical protein